jgi:hypothetical protein
MSLEAKAGVGGVEALAEWKKVSHFWPRQPAEDKLHVLVKLPVAGKQALVVYVYEWCRKCYFDINFPL